MKIFSPLSFASGFCALVCVATFALPAQEARAQSFLTDFSRAVGNLFAPKIVGSGNVVQETRNFTAFHTVRIDEPFYVVVDCSAGGAPSVFVQADDNIAPLISTSWKNGVLTVSLDNEINARGFESANLKIIVYAPESNNVELLGAGSVNVVKIHRSECNLTLNGVGSISASGATERLTINAQGIGSIDAKRVKAQHATVHSHGIGSTQVYASASLDADLGGIGSLTYYGNPPIVHQQAGGIGSVHKGKGDVEP